MTDLWKSAFLQREGGPSSPGITDIAEVVRRSPVEAHGDSVRLFVVMPI